MGFSAQGSRGFRGLGFRVYCLGVQFRGLGFRGLGLRGEGPFGFRGEVQGSSLHFFGAKGLSGLFGLGLAESGARVHLKKLVAQQAGYECREK